MGEPIWQPSAERVAASNLTRFAAFARDQFGAPAGDYAALWRWSVEQREQFWTAMMQFAGVLHTPGTAPVLQHRDRMPPGPYNSRSMSKIVRACSMSFLISVLATGQEA